MKSMWGVIVEFSSRDIIDKAGKKKRKKERDLYWSVNAFDSRSVVSFGITENGTYRKRLFEKVFYNDWIISRALID